MERAAGELFSYEDARDANETVYDFADNPSAIARGLWTKEFVAAAAGFETLKYYENHLANSGETPSHKAMEELLTEFAGAEVDKLIDLKKLQHIDAEKTKKQAVEQAKELAKQKYNGGTGPDS